MITLVHKVRWTRLARNNIYIDANGQISLDELRLVPKVSSTGAEGTIYYDSDDDHVYVATE